MKTLIAMTLLIGTATAYGNPMWTLKKFEGKIYATPLAIEMKLVENGPGIDSACDTISYYLKSAVEKHEKFCTDPASADCKKVMEEVKYHASYTGPISKSFYLKPDLENIQKMKGLIASENDVRSEDVVILVPAENEILKKTRWSMGTSSSAKFFEPLMRTFGYRIGVDFDRDTGEIRVKNGLEYCLLKERERNFVGMMNFKMEMKSEIPAADIKGLFATYQSVANDYRLTENWENTLHKVLAIGASLDRRAEENNSPVRKLSELFDFFFKHYEEDNTVHLEKLSLAEVAGKLTPARQESLEVTINMVQE